MADLGQSRFDRLIANQYETVKHEVLATVRAKLAAAHLRSDPLDLDAAYNAAWHALYEQSVRGGAGVENLGGWLATIAYRRAIDDVRSARPRLHADAAAASQTNALSDGCYERDVDDEISARQKYHQWLMSVRLRLSAREQQAVSLCVLHEHSRREASELMGIDVRRLDKIMTSANKKLGGALEAISRGDWCEDQRSLIKAYAFGLHDEGGARYALAVQHIVHCQACAAYVRSVRGLAGVMPPGVLLAGAVSAAGGVLSGRAAVFKGGTSGTAAAGGAAAGGSSATLLGGLAAKSALVCATAVCATGGALVVIERAPS
ncbi:MAG TPA: sigma-70 family RNA polymerase sigma factor, partial [Solirubrobacteraceae bacterium]|nr:sigma-70 family RNA polymerase sigma factor [Solirubrobacteraceae bacterium]